MKKIIFILFLCPMIVWGQKKKPLKPSIVKAEKAFQTGALDIAKSLIDVTVKSEKYSSKPKAWYLKGVIYVSIDTTKKENFKSLANNPFSTATESFAKFKSLEDPKSPVFITGKQGLPMLPNQIGSYFAQYYFETGLKAYQDDKDYKKALNNIKKALYFIPEDTSALLNAGVFFAPAAEEYEQSNSYLEKYLDMGGGSTDAYTVLFGNYRDQLKDNEKALTIAQKAMVAHPENTYFPKYQLDMYIRMNKLDEAKEVMTKQAENDPEDAETRYYLGLLSQELKDNKEAEKWYREAAKIDPNHLDANIAIAELVYLEAKKIKSKMNQLGISKEDKQKRFALDKELVEKLKKSLPYWENCEKIDENHIATLDKLLTIYGDLGMESGVTRIKKKMKALGL